MSPNAAATLFALSLNESIHESADHAVAAVERHRDHTYPPK